MHIFFEDPKRVFGATHHQLKEEEEVNSASSCLLPGLAAPLNGLHTGVRRTIFWFLESKYDHLRGLFFLKVQSQIQDFKCWCKIHFSGEYNINASSMTLPKY